MVVNMSPKSPVSKVRVGDLVFSKDPSPLKMLVVFMFSNIGSPTSQEKVYIGKVLVVTIYHTSPSVETIS